MSQDWEIECLEHNDVHPFEDANHQDDLMRLLIREAPAIGALARLQAQLDEQGATVDLLRTRYGRIDAAWFAEHACCVLAPRSEYGEYKFEGRLVLQNASEPFERLRADLRFEALRKSGGLQWAVELPAPKPLRGLPFWSGRHPISGPSSVIRCAVDAACDGLALRRGEHYRELFARSAVYLTVSRDDYLAGRTAIGAGVLYHIEGVGE